MILLGAFSGLDKIDFYFTIFMWAAIFIALILVVFSFYRRETGYRILLGILCTGFLVVSYFCFQHELGFYFSGGVLAAISAFGLYKTFSR